MSISNISVPWECVCDGKTKVGQRFSVIMDQLLDAGYPLDIETPSGKRTFTTIAEFSAWFESLT